MKFFLTSQIRELDRYTIEHEPIASVDLMERAAFAIYEKYLQTFDYKRPVCVLAGPGNNGGDALALARMLLSAGLNVSTFLLYTDTLSADCQINKIRLVEKFPDRLSELKTSFVAPAVSADTVIVDGLFGSGLSRPLTGIFAEAVDWINKSGCQVVSIDLPSGLQGEENADVSVPIVKADVTYTLQFPKLAFFLAENAPFVSNWQRIDIGLHPQAMEATDSKLYYLDDEEVAPLLFNRKKFSHKGNFGHVCIVAGSSGMAGAVVLSAKAALRSGAGLVTVHSAADNRVILQTSVPEAIFQSDKANDFCTEILFPEKFNVMAVGPGIGTRLQTQEMLHQFLKTTDSPCVLDADALNIIGEQKDFLPLIPRNSVLTPHPKEFERLFGNCNSAYERVKKAEEAAKKFGIIIVLKGANTLIAMPDGTLFFNSTGNAGMATAGSGDVLTGILTGLLAQGYTPDSAAKMGVFLHGRAGDLALATQSEESLIATDIIENLGKAFSSLRSFNKI